MNEFKPTVHWATKTLLEEIPVIIGAKSILDPWASSSARILESHCKDAKVITNHVNKSINAEHHFDMIYRASWSNFPPVDWIVSVPNFVYADKLLEYSLRQTKVGVAFLLKISFLEPAENRQILLSERPPHELIVLPRVSLSEDGKFDSVTCAWMIWYSNVPQSSIKVIRKS